MRTDCVIIRLYPTIHHLHPVTPWCMEPVKVSIEQLVQLEPTIMGQLVAYQSQPMVC